MLEKYIFLRGKKYQYRRRIPGFVAHLDPRKEIVLSLKTDKKNQALLKAQIYNDHIENYWRALIQSGTADTSTAKYKAAVKLAQAHGFAYKTATQIADSQLQDIINRVSSDLRSPQDVEAVLGGVEVPCITLSDCQQDYWRLVIDRTSNKSEHQKKKWENPRKAALNNFIALIGNKPILQVTRTDVLNFKSWCRDKIQEGWNTDTANKQLRFVKDILQTVATENQLDIDADMLFAKTKFQINTNSRPPFEADYVQNTLLKSLETLNHKDKMVVYAIADTGARIAEIFGLSPQDIFLDCEIPYIWIRARDGYSLKTKTSERKIPLVGTALYAFQQFPNGFEQEGNPDSFSGNVNKYLRTNNLKPTEQHSIYSLRHTFKDRLRDIEAPEEIIDGLMGHKKSGPKYGRGHKLETKHKWMDKIAFTL
jgi:integrase